MGYIILIIALMIPLVAVVLDSHLGRALAEYISRRGGEPLQSAGSSQRLQALESEVDRLGKEVMRLEEETQFLHRLLEAKPAKPHELPPESNPR
jgi:hypothetical protein